MRVNKNRNCVFLIPNPPPRLSKTPNQINKSSALRITLTFPSPPPKNLQTCRLYFIVSSLSITNIFIQHIPMHFLRLSLSLWFSMSLSNLRRIERNLIERKYFHWNVRQKKSFFVLYLYCPIHANKFFYGHGSTGCVWEFM